MPSARRRRDHEKDGTVCVAQAADCMPVLFADVDGTTVGAAHAGWRGLSAGVLEATLDAMRVPSNAAWLGPAIGPQVYEVGDEVRAVFPGHESAFRPTRGRDTGCSTCTPWRAPSSRVCSRSRAAASARSANPNAFLLSRDRTASRMGAFIWLA